LDQRAERHSRRRGAGLCGTHAHLISRAGNYRYNIGTALGLLVVLILFFANGVFVAAEFSFVAVDRGRIEAMSAKGNVGARFVERILHRLAFYLSGTQLGVTVTSLLIGFIAEPTVAALFEPLVGNALAIVLSLILVTVASMVLSELIPKNLAIARAQGISVVLARPVLYFATAFRPAIQLVNSTANATVRKFGVEPQEELAAVRALDEYELLFQSSGAEGTIDSDALNLLTRTLRFNDKTAADALVPRVQVKYTNPDAMIPELVALSVSTGSSRFPVCGTDLDDVVGVVHVKDVYRLPFDERSSATVGSVMSEPFFVPESRELSSVLRDLREGGHLAVVVDEYGGTAGIITLEDVLEEIVGEIDDEYDAATPALTRVLPAGTYELPGTLHPDEVRYACGFDMPEGEYETLAGFVLDRLGRIPDVGDQFGFDGWLVEVIEMDRRRVARLRLTAPERSDAATAGGAST
jgi:CBS domain containing-hemolysin-like protein